MKIFYTASLSEREVYKEFYEAVIKTIISNKDEIISLEVQEYSHLISQDIINAVPKAEIHYTWLKKGIKKSNCVIIDASKDSFRLGHEATLALLYDKPVLCLSNKKDYSDAIINPRFYTAKYETSQDIVDAINKFLKVVKKNHIGLRKNIYITSELTNFLNWYGNKNNMNDSEIIRELINDLILKNQDYANAEIEDLNINEVENE